MHDTAYELGKLFFNTYAQKPNLKILEIGSLNVNGSLRDHAPSKSEYTGVDLSAGPDVDVVLNDPYVLPFEDESFDIIVSSSCFEHLQFFWLTLTEAFRVLKKDGFFYINAPSNGIYHDYPYDNWRFYPDSSLAMRDWLIRNNFPCTLIESGIFNRQKDIWNDFVVILQKSNESNRMHESTLAEACHGKLGLRNYRSIQSDQVLLFNPTTEDMTLLSEKNKELEQIQTKYNKITDSYYWKLITPALKIIRHVKQKIYQI